MHHVHLDQWSRGSSPLHRRDPRAKILALLVFLIVLATTPANAALTLAIDATLLVAAILIAGLPLFDLLGKAMVVLPFSLTFGAISWLAGDPLRALALIEKSYLSTVAVLLVIGATPLPALLSGMERLGAPRMLVLVAQFLYRYLFVISEQAQHMRLAAACRQGDPRFHRKGRFSAASGALGTLVRAFLLSCRGNPSGHAGAGLHRPVSASEFPAISPLRWCFRACIRGLFHSGACPMTR